MGSYLERALVRQPRIFPLLNAFDDQKKCSSTKLWNPNKPCKDCNSLVLDSKYTYVIIYIGLVHVPSVSLTDSIYMLASVLRGWFADRTYSDCFPLQIYLQMYGDGKLLLKNRSLYTDETRLWGGGPWPLKFQYTFIYVWSWPPPNFGVPSFTPSHFDIHQQ